MANVPNAPGVPVLPGGFSPAPAPVVAQSDTVSEGSADAAGGTGDNSPQWGLFDSSGNPVLVGDATVTFGYTHEWRVSDYPVEDGGFQSYNKVQTPIEGKITYAVGKTVANRQAFLLQAEALCDSTTLYNLVSPEVTAVNVTPYHVGYERSAAKGAQLIPVDVWFREIRVAPSPLFTQTATPGGADAQNDGTVAPQDATGAQQAAVKDQTGRADPTVDLP